MENERFPLDDAMISVLADVKREQQRLQQEFGMLQAQRNGALVLFLRQHELKGDWDVSEDGRELIQKPATPATPATPQPGSE